MKPEIIRMSQLEEGQAGVVAGMRLLGGIRRRMLDLGLITGTRVVCLRRAPSGSPIAYEIRGAIIALRRVDATQILVRVETQ